MSELQKRPRQTLTGSGGVGGGGILTGRRRRKVIWIRKVRLKEKFDQNVLFGAARVSGKPF